jgi:4,5-DOPA dioxygenase extradiol
MSEMSEQHKAQVVYFSHGGGPLPILGDPYHKAMVDFMKKCPTYLHRPEAILVISAHWEEPVATVLGSPNPPLFYDYYGFPEQAYSITYPAPGDPLLSNRILEILNSAGVPTGVDPQRGFDHGVFIPLKLMYPEADIPVAQLSLVQGLDPATHFSIGQLLRELNNQNVLVIGSGFSFHNLRVFFSQMNRISEGPDPMNDAFQEWLIETCTGDLTPSTREERLIHWEQAPNARYCHPREEHFMPVVVCAGMAGQLGEVIFDDQILGKRSVAFLWR